MTARDIELTLAQIKALRWLQEHGGTGIFDKHGVLLAKGESAPVTRSTWQVLRDLWFVTIERKRLTITKPGTERLASEKPPLVLGDLPMQSERTSRTSIPLEDA
jgi:hypothetical protein